MRRGFLLLALPAAFLVAAPQAALGAANHPFLGVAGSAFYEDACGVALYGGGLYVSDYYHDAVDLPGGEQIAPEDPHGGPCKLALDTQGDLYVYDFHHDVLKYGAGELAAGEGTVIDPTEPGAEAATGLALDPTTGDLYVAHRTYISEYGPSGAPVEVGGEPVKIGLDEHATYYGIAASGFPATTGYLYAADAASNAVRVFDPATSLTTPIEEIDGEATPQGRFLDLHDGEALVDNNPTSPSYGHLFVLDRISQKEHPEAVLDEFNASGAYRGQIAGFTDAEPSGVAIEASTGNVYVTSGNSEGSAVFKYGPTAPARTLKVAKIGAGGGTVTSSPAGVKCGGACEAEFDDGKTVTLFAAPDGHSTFSGWGVTGAEPCPGTGTCTILMSRNVEVAAEFEEPTQQALTVSVTGAGEGTVTSEPAGISCGSGTCTEQFAEGRRITLTATPAPHSRFAGWGGPDCDESIQLTCELTMSAAKSLSAKFEPIPPQTLTLSVSGEGAVVSFPAGISCPGSCSASFDEGSSPYLVAIAAPGAEFEGWGGACAGSPSLCLLTMTGPESVSASFGSPFAQAQALAAPRLAGRSAAVPRSGSPPSAKTAPPRPDRRRAHKHRRKHHHRKHKAHR